MEPSHDRLSVLIDFDLLPAVAEFLKSDHGLWVEGSPRLGNGSILDVRNPATGEPLIQLHSASASNVDEAVASAKRVFEEGEWRSLTPDARASVLWKWAELIERDRKVLAQLETLDNGKPLHESENIDVSSAAATFRYFAGWVTKFGGDTYPVSWPRHLNYSLRQPLGVCGVIIPWNFPLIMASRYIAPAIAMGNSVVLKPSEETPLTALWLAQLSMEAGVPSGVLSVIPGLGEVAGAHLAQHPDVGRLSFTGGESAARSVVGASVRNFKRLSLELGGKNPQIVLGDVRLGEVLGGVINGGFYNGGQNCAAGARVYVQRSILDEFLDRAVAAVQKLKVGPGWYPDVDLGPVISEQHLQRISGLLQEGLSSGATLVAGGDRPDDVPTQGYFLSPTLVQVPDDDNVVVQKEIFGPVITVMDFDDVDEVVARANATRFGLTAGVWTRDISIAHRLSDELRVGTVWINGWDRWDAASPFGGIKQSGYGSSYGREALEQFTALKSVWVNYSS